jgi:2-amino-4-hydroxy-6-hydroxymethyldihydropteridine diphosphokinase
MPDIAYIALGSNLGDRDAHLRFARDRIARLPDTRVVAESEVEETDPVGPVVQGAFLNQMIAVETSLEPHTLLAALQEIEHAAGRVRTTRWGPRTLDLDIVLMEGRSIDDPDLRIPHPELDARDFWRRELAQVRVR